MRILSSLHFVGLPVLSCLKVLKWDFWKCTAGTCSQSFEVPEHTILCPVPNLLWGKLWEMLWVFFFWGNSHVMSSSLCQTISNTHCVLHLTNQGTISSRLTSISQSKFLPLFVDLVTGGFPHKSPVSCPWFLWDPVHTDPSANKSWLREVEVSCNHSSGSTALPCLAFPSTGHRAGIQSSASSLAVSAMPITPGEQ